MSEILNITTPVTYFAVLVLWCLQRDWRERLLTKTLTWLKNPIIICIIVLISFKGTEMRERVLE